MSYNKLFKFDRKLTEAIGLALRASLASSQLFHSKALVAEGKHARKYPSSVDRSDFFVRS